MEPGRRWPLPPHDRAVARRPVEAARGDLCRRGLALGRRRRDLAPFEHGHRAGVRPRGRAGQPDPTLRPRRPPLARTARAALHAVPRRRLPLRRRRGELDRRRRGPALRLRLPGRRRPRGSRQRLRDPVDRRGGPDDAGWLRAGLGDARRGSDLDCARRGLPAQDAYLTVLREAFDSTGRATGSSSTSARPRATSSVPPMREAPGRRLPSTSRPSTRCARRRSRSGVEARRVDLLDGHSHRDPRLCGVPRPGSAGTTSS